ncbi:MAG: hypothetical protein ACI36Y_03450 [Coriobacteriales bacterium]
MAFDWNASGRVDSFRFEKVSCRDINKSLGYLEGVTGGTLSFDYNSELKVSGKLTLGDMDPQAAEQEHLIRVWYCPRLNGEVREICLATCYFTASTHYERGHCRGTLTLRSALARHVDDVLATQWKVRKGRKFSNEYKAVFKALGGWGRIAGVRDGTASKNKVFDVGETPMSVLQYLADCVGGEIAVSPLGHTVLQPYRRPSAKAKDAVAAIQADASSVIVSGVDITNSLKEIPNRVVCTYTRTEAKKKTTYVGKAALSSKEARSYQRIGKWVTQHYTVDEVSGKTAASIKSFLSSKAKAKLEKLNSKRVFYEFECYYQPIEIGQVIKLVYGDISVKGLVTNLDIDIGVGAKMKVRIRRV